MNVADPVVTWTDPARVARALGPSVDVDDDQLADCVDAANAWAWRKRQEAGYDDEPDHAGGDIIMGTTFYAVALYRERGSADSFASFDELDTFIPTGTMGQIKRLLGIGRGRVDAVLDVPVVGHRSRWGRLWGP